MYFRLYQEILISAYKNLLISPFTKYHLTLYFNSGTHEKSATFILNTFLKNLNETILKNDYGNSGQYLEGVAIRERTPEMNNVYFHILFFDPVNKLPNKERFNEIINLNKSESSENSARNYLLENYCPDDAKKSLRYHLTNSVKRSNLSTERGMYNVCPLSFGNVIFGH
jgi:hypothetical protein